MTRAVHLGIGSNLGDRERHLRRAVEAIARWPEVQRVRVSPVYRTVHVGEDPLAPDYLNACVVLEGAPAADEILRRAQRLEWAAGRAPDSHARPRPLDVDVLLDGDRVHETDRLRVPHPRLTDRRFVLQPLADLDPGLEITGTGTTVEQLLARPEVAAQSVERTDVDLAP